MTELLTPPEPTETVAATAPAPWAPALKPDTKESPMPDPKPSAVRTAPRSPRAPGRAPALGRALARRWPALTGAALVTALMPVGVALAAQTPFPDGITAGASTFHVAMGTALTAIADGGIAPAVFVSGGLTATGVKARGLTGVEAEGEQAGVTASSANGVAVVAGGKTAGVVASSANGTAVKASSANSTALEATGKGAGVVATAADGSGVIGSGSGPFGIGVVGNGTFSGGQFSSPAGAAVSASANGAGPGVSASSHDGLGGQFSGARAPIRLVPAGTQGPPQPASGAHQAGELYVDSTGRLFICTGAGTPGTWALVGLQTMPAAETP